MNVITVIAMHCPSCVTASDSPMTAGARAGATVLIIVVGIVLSFILRFALRIARHSRAL